MRLLTAGVLLLLAASQAFALSDEMQNQLDAFQDAANKKGQEAVRAKAVWTAAPNYATQNEFNRLRSQARTLYKDYRQALVAAIQADRAASWITLAVETADGSVDSIGGAISDAATGLFGASQDDLYGPNWQQINGQFNGMSAKYRDIVARMQAAKAKPDNEAEITAIRAEIEGMRKRYEILRKAIRAEQRNVGFAATFWGEDYMGRYIEACIEGFDVTAIVLDVVTGNIKLAYDVFKPAILLKIGDWMAGNATHLTPKIKDAIVTDILGVGPSQVDEAADALRGNYIIDPAKDKLLKTYSNAMKEEFAGLKGPLMKGVQGKVEQEMSEEFLAHVQNLPYESLPGGAAADMKDVAEKYFKSNAVRDRFMKKTEAGIAKEVEKLAEMNKLGYAAGKAEKLGGKLETAGTMFDFGMEFVGIYADSPLLKAALEAADHRAALIRQYYKDGKVDASEVTEDEYVNKIWFGEWKMFSPLGSKAAEQAQTKNEQEIARYVSTQKAIKEQVDANDKTAETEAGGYQSADADAAIAAYKDLVGKIERDVASMGPADLIAAESSAYQAGAGVLGAVEAQNGKVFSVKEAAHNKTIGSVLPNPGESSHDFSVRLDALSSQLYRDTIDERAKYRKIEAKAEIALQKAEAEQLGKWLKKGNDGVEALKGFLASASALSARAIAATAGAAGTCDEDRDELVRTQGIPAYFKVEDIGRLIAAVSKLAQCQRNLATSLTTRIDSASQAMESFANDSDRLQGQAADEIEKSALWVDLVLTQGTSLTTRIDSISRAVESFAKDSDRLQGQAADESEKRAPQDTCQRGGTECGSPRPFDRASRAGDMLLQGGQDTLASLDAWISKAQGMLDGLDPDRLDKWISSMRAYADALQKRDAIRLRVSALGDERNAQGTRIRSALDILTGQAAMTSGEPATLNYLAGIFSQGAANAYAPPTVKTAAWVLQAKYTPQGLRASADRLLAPGVLRDYLSDTYTEALVGAKQSLYELDGPIRAGFAALTGESPGFGMRLDTLPSEASFFPTSPESDETNRGLLKRLDNLYRGLADLPGAIVLQEGAQNAYRKAVKDYYTQMILLDVAACDKADKLLDATKPDEAQKTLDAVVGQYPSYPNLPEGVWIDDGVKPENIVGVADALAADQKRKTDLAIRITQMKRTVGDEGSIAAIRDLYVKFKQAYQAKDDARVMSFIGDRWEAGDGTTLSDLQENLRNSFGMFDSISYDLQNLRIRRQADGDFVVTYDVAIVSRIFKDNLTHQEKSSVSEMVSVGASGKAKIVRTLTGNYWLIQ